ncbi:MAG: hypothetical protein K0U13_00845 [Chlamydiae bacterium]|nr:hypothetical protein [Chlamydiota bacterium]
MQTGFVALVACGVLGMLGKLPLLPSASFAMTAMGGSCILASLLTIPVLSLKGACLSDQGGG